jgi:hypothetical protein
MSINLYERKSYNSAKYDAQLNLSGRTHYVDDDTLRFHHARILETRTHDNGLLFSLIESCAKDMHNTSRTFRYVIFDLFGNVIARPDLEDGFNTSLKARKALYEKLNTFDAEQVTNEGFDKWETQHIRERDYIRERVTRALEQGKAAA